MGDDSNLPWGGKTPPWASDIGSTIWKTEAAYWSYVRGTLRRAFKTYPLKLEWKKRQLRPIMEWEKANYHRAVKSLGECSFCGLFWPSSYLEVDHIVGSEGCTSKEKAESFLWHSIGRIEDDFRLVCKPCHKVQTHSQKTGLPFKEAKADLTAITICKAGDAHKFLISKKIQPASTMKARRKQLFDYFINENT